MALYRISLLCAMAMTVSACAGASHKPQTTSHKKLKLVTIDHGPMRPKTYLYREVDEPAAR